MMQPQEDNHSFEFFWSPAYADRRPDPDAHLEQAETLLETDDISGALVECDLALFSRPSWADASNLRGIILEELGRKREALTAYIDAYEIDPSFQEARDNARELENEIGDPLTNADALLNSLHDGDPAERCDAAAQLAHQPADFAVENLLITLEDELPVVRSAAAAALSAHPGPLAEQGLYFAYHQSQVNFPAFNRMEPLDHNLWVTRARRRWHERRSYLEALAFLQCGDFLISALRRELSELALLNTLLGVETLANLDQEYLWTQELAAHWLSTALPVEGLFRWVEQQIELRSSPAAFAAEPDELASAAAAALGMIARRKNVPGAQEIARRLASLPLLTTLDGTVLYRWE